MPQSLHYKATDSTKQQTVAKVKCIYLLQIESHIISHKHTHTTILQLSWILSGITVKITVKMAY